MAFNRIDLSKFFIAKQKGEKTMKKQYFIVLATAATMVIGLGSLASVQGSDVVVEKPGITIVQDAQGDLLLRRCDPTYPGVPCSLFPSAQPLPTLPGYFDVRNAKIIQHGRKWVDLFIALYEPIPAEPPYGFIDYFWQFEGGCVEGSNVDKAGVHVGWNGSAWTANWYVIVECRPRRITAPGDPVPFEFTEDGVKVRLRLEDLLTAIEPTIGYLEWHAGVRRVPFIYPQGCTNDCWNTTALDYAPDVLEFLPCTPPSGPCAQNPEEPTTWEER
jgi:hypothetical protein